VGDAPEVPPGQERWPGHFSPSFDAEPSVHAWPAGASHLEHTDADESEKWPNSHAVHTDANVPENLPASHLEQLLEPSFEYLPSSHVPEHVEAPVVAENLPASHWEHSPPSFEYLPASQGWHALFPAPSSP